MECGRREGDGALCIVIEEAERESKRERRKSRKGKNPAEIDPEMTSPLSSTTASGRAVSDPLRYSYY